MSKLPLSAVLKMGGLSAALLSLGACGGGGGGGSQIASIPAPPASPTSAPPPPLQPTPTGYQPFDQTKDLSTFAFGLPGDLTITLAPDGNYVIKKFDYRSFQVGPGTNSYEFTQPSPRLFNIDVYGFGGSSFQVTDGGPRFYQRGLDGEILQVSKPGSGLDLTYTRFGNYTGYNQSSNSATGTSGYVSFLALGVPTASSDVPSTGSATFSGFVDGLWDDGATTRRLYGSTATLSADFGTGKLLTTLSLSGRDNAFGDFTNGPLVALGTFSGSGAITSGKNYFSGAMSGPIGWTGSFAGGFNGPSASEYGYVFGLGNSNGAVASGVAVGKRN